MITESYQIICPSCNGTGLIKTEPAWSTTMVHQVCPACRGSKVITVTRTFPNEEIQEKANKIKRGLFK